VLPELHEALKTLIYEKGRIKPVEVDVTFEVPSKEWSDKLVRPTINLYLVELQENMELRQAQFQSTRSNGHAQFRPTPRRIDLRYVVTALTKDTDDAFRLLWHVLGVLMRAPELDADLFPSDLKLDAPIVTRVAQADSGIKLLDVWSALSAEPHAAFCYVVTLPVDLELVIETPFVFGRSIGFSSLSQTEGGPESHTFIKGVVRDTTGTPLEEVTIATVKPPLHAAVTRADGTYSLRTPASGKLEVRLTGEDGRSATAELDLDATQASYDLVLS
jgi:hypothetical protein